MDAVRCTISSTPSDARSEPGPRHRRCGPADGSGDPRGFGRGGPGDGPRGSSRVGWHDGPRGFGRGDLDDERGGFGPRGRHEGEGPDGPGFGRGHGPGGRGRGPGGPRRGRGPGGRGPGGPGGGRGGDPELPGFLPPGARVGRGDIRAGILVLLLEGPMHGYQLIHEIHERSGNVWRPSPGSVYPTLKRLSAEGLVTSEEGEGRGHRRAFSLSEAGTEEATRLAAESTPWEALVGEDDRGALELRDLVVSVVDAARQVVRVAEPSQAAEAKQVLVEARRRLYGILAAEPAEPEATDGGSVSAEVPADGGPAADTGSSEGETA